MFKGNPIVFQGFLIPSDNALFLTMLSIHVLAALTCLRAFFIAPVANFSLTVSNNEVQHFQT